MINASFLWARADNQIYISRDCLLFSNATPVFHSSQGTSVGHIMDTLENKTCFIYKAAFCLPNDTFFVCFLKSLFILMDNCDNAIHCNKILGGYCDTGIWHRHVPSFHRVEFREIALLPVHSQKPKGAKLYFSLFPYSSLLTKVHVVYSLKCF